MKTDECVSRQNVPAVMESGLFDNGLSNQRKAGEGMENKILEEDIDERHRNMKAIGKDSTEVIKSDNGLNRRETAEEDMYVDCRRWLVRKEDQTAHYAQIVTKKPCSLPISSTRRTRESSNPILRLYYGDEDRSICGPDSEECRPCGIAQAQHDSPLYENTSTTHSHPKVQYGRSDSGIAYVNTTQESEANVNDSHVYVNFENTTGTNNDDKGKNEKANPTYETSDSESLYEDIDDVYEEMSPRSSSKPINIVYASIDFSSKNISPSSVGSGSLSSSVGSLERPDLRRSPSCSSGYFSWSSRSLDVDKPPELPQRTSGSFLRRPRPTSLHLGSCNDLSVLTEFGLYTGTLVGSCAVLKNSPKSVQHIIADFLAREKKERSKPVSIEVNGEFLRLSLNCAPWSLLAQNTIDDIGCVTTFSANNKTALGYTISKPGEDARCYVVHCSDADAIKNSIMSTFKTPDPPSLSRWSSMSSLGTSWSGKSRSLPRMRGPSKHELANFDDLIYLGSYKVKKSPLVVNDNILSVLNHSDSKHYKYAKVELYRDAIHLKDIKADRILDIQQLDWILSMGLFDEDRRYFGYVSSTAFQGSKTRTFCHVFRCNRVGLAREILETIRQACQATFLAKMPDHSSEFRFRTNSSASSSSEGSMSSSSETMSVGSTSPSPPDIDRKPSHMRRRPRLLTKTSRDRMSTILSFGEDDASNEILEEKDEFEVATKATEHRFNVSYLCSTIVSPPLKPKHVKECLKQFQKTVDKAMKKSSSNAPRYQNVELVINQNGIMIVDDPAKPPQAFFERTSLSHVQVHPDGKCAFAFSTTVSGNTKHKCHLFLQDKEPMGEIIKVFNHTFSKKSLQYTS